MSTLFVLCMFQLSGAIFAILCQEVFKVLGTKFTSMYAKVYVVCLLILMCIMSALLPFTLFVPANV